MFAEKYGRMEHKEKLPKNLEDEKVKCCPHFIGFLIKIKSN
jgi:hypothetical protein